MNIQLHKFIASIVAMTSPFACIVQPSSAQEGRRIAIVVGNDEYRPNQGLENLHQAINDARSLSATLRSIGFSKVIEMTHEVATKPGKAIFAPNEDYIRDQLDAIIETPNLGANDIILVSLHGHGVQYSLTETVTKNGKKTEVTTPKFFFCPADAWVKDLQTVADITSRNHLIPLDEIYAKLSQCKAATRLLIVDACRNDPTKPKLSRDTKLSSVSLPALPPPPGGIAAFFSCKANQEAIEDSELKQGVFTHFLIEGLQGKADLPFAKKPADGIVTISELTTYVANNTYSYVMDKHPGRKQSPDMKGEFDTNLPLSRIQQDAQASDKELINTLNMKLLLIPAGEFLMGSTPSEIAEYALLDANFDKSIADKEQPQHRVKISRPFYMGATEVTRGQFAEFVRAANYKTEAEKDGKGGVGFDEATSKTEQKVEYTWKSPGFSQTDSHPVVNVSWNDAVAFCEWLSKKEGRKYQLPTEARWEYACRGGVKVNAFFASGNDPESLAAIGNVADATAKAKFSTLRSIKAKDGNVFTAPVGRYQANPFGLQDMHGNVLEWCSDWYGEYNGQASTDPVGAKEGSYRVYRGGGWHGNAGYCRSAFRSGDSPVFRYFNLGFRVSLDPTAK